MTTEILTAKIKSQAQQIKNLRLEINDLRAARISDIVDLRQTIRAEIEAELRAEARDANSVARLNDRIDELVADAERLIDLNHALRFVDLDLAIDHLVLASEVDHHRRPHPRAPGAGRPSNLSLDAQREIFARVAAGESKADLARTLGVLRAMIYRAVAAVKAELDRRTHSAERVVLANSMAELQTKLAEAQVNQQALLEGEAALISEIGKLSRPAGNRLATTAATGGD